MDLKYQSVLVSRPLAKFHPDVWGSRFLSFIPKSKAEMQAEEQLVEVLKEGIKRELKETSNDYMRQLRMVDAIQRLGIEYHFEEEVDQTLKSIFAKYHDFCKENHDIHSTSLSFRLLRQHGYGVSCEIFEKFKDAEGDFMVPDPQDVMGLLEFYEATHLRIHGEDVLDRGFLFSKKYLESILPSLSNPLAEQVHHALKECSNRRGIPRLEARRYISIYGQHASHHQGLLKLSKLDFNRLQSLHKEELSELCRWWRDLEVPTKLSYARDRLVETYFWDLGVYFEPKYAVARKILTKGQAILSLVDDTYGTFEELEVFTEAIERWSFSCLNQLPNNMKIVYKALLELFEEIAEEMNKQGTSYRVSYGKAAVKHLCRAYFAEIKWREERYKPTTEEYMRLATKSCGFTTLTIISFLGIDNHIASKEAFDWVFSEPDIVRAALKICRLRDDIVGHEFEQNRDHIPSSVHCYMNEHMVPKQEAIDELNNQTEEAWKVLNEGFLRLTNIPAPLLYRIINFARVIAVLYSKGDWYTHVGPEMKSFIHQLFIDPVPED